MKNLSRTVQLQVDNQNENNKFGDLGNNMQSTKSILKSKTHGIGSAKTDSDKI